jgi:hypothetical protein
MNCRNRGSPGIARLIRRLDGNAIGARIFAPIFI